MNGQAFPLFTSGHLLRQEMLEATADYAFLFGELLYEGYSDGILSGCHLTATADSILLNPGILCHNGKLYLIKRPLSVVYHPTNTTCILKARFSDASQTDNFIYYDMELALNEETICCGNELELCRFKLQPGAMLRHRYVDFEDRTTEYDTLNTIHAPFAAQGRSTLSPEITQAYARELLQASCDDPVDASFCMQALNYERPVAAEAIAAYLHVRLGIRWGERKITNAHLYEGLLKLLAAVKRGNVQKGGRAPSQRRKIIVD